MQRAAPSAEPAVPSTPAQHGRRDRILETATVILNAGGEDALQMKELAQRADVSLATLSRYEQALARVRAEPARAGSMRERVTAHLLREFRAGQREPLLTAALSHAVTETSRTFSSAIEQIEGTHLQVIRHVAAAGERLAPWPEAVLPVVADVFNAATRRWLAGMSSPARTRAEIRLGGRLLDLPEELLDEEPGPAAPDPT
jgi:TetR/AcrR family transcriptional regulator, cholesterol catabolism regulator